MERLRAVSMLLLGAWLGGTLFMWFLAGASFSTVERVLRSPQPKFVETSRLLGETSTRLVLRHLASELNRTVFRGWSWAQVVLGGLLFAALLVQSPRDGTALALVAAMLGLVLVMTLWITPELTALGRSLDFVPRNPAPEGMARFRMLHRIYTGLDAAKLVAGLAVAARWLVPFQLNSPSPGMGGDAKLSGDVAH